MLLGSREDVYLGELSAVYFSGDPEWEETPLEVTDAFSADPSVAEISLEYPDLYITGKKAGSTRITVAYEGPEGPGTTDFNVSVKEAVYRFFVREDPDSYTAGLLKPNSSKDLRLFVYRMNAGDEQYTPVDENEVTVVWSNIPIDHEDIFDLKGNGFSAVLSAGSLPYHVEAIGYLLAEVYLGSEVSESSRIGSARYSYEAADYTHSRDVNISAHGRELFDDPASEAVIVLSTDEYRKKHLAPKWVAFEVGEDGEDGERLGPVDYPFGDAGSSLSTTVNGQILAGLISEGSDVEIFAVVGDENGLEETTDSVYISIRRGVENIYCNVEDINILPGEEYSLPVYVTASVVNMDYPDGEEMDCEILGADIEDPSVAEMSFEDGMLYVKGMKTGRTGAYIIYARPDGEEGLCDYTVTVADVFYDVYIDDSCAENEMLTGDRADLKAVAGRYTDAGYTELGDDEIDVVWQTEPEDEEVPASDFTLLTDGSSATLIVTGDADPEEAIQAVLVRAHVYLKGTDEESGFDEIRHSHVPSATVLVVKDTLGDDALEEGESFTITPSVIRRKELGSKVSEEREDKARFGLEFDPSQVRVTDQNGQEVEPAELDDDDCLVGSQADGVVYTVTRLTTEYIEISLTAVWPDGDGSDASCQRMAWKIFCLGSLEEDEPGEPSGGDEITPQGGSGRDKEAAVPSSAGKTGKAASSSKAAKTNRTTKISRTAKKTETGDTSDAMLWILLMAASAFACTAAAGSLRKKTR